METFPAWETLPHERLSPRADTVGRRWPCGDLTHPGENGTIDVLVAPVRSVLQLLAPGLGDQVPVELKAGDSADLDDVARALVDAAYTRVELVEKRGEFAVRGGLLDVFPPTEPHPAREFWGDEVDELATSPRRPAVVASVRAPVGTALQREAALAPVRKGRRPRGRAPERLDPRQAGRGHAVEGWSP